MCVRIDYCIRFFSFFVCGWHTRRPPSSDVETKYRFYWRFLTFFVASLFCFVLECVFAVRILSSIFVSISSECLSLCLVFFFVFCLCLPTWSVSKIDVHNKNDWDLFYYFPFGLFSFGDVKCNKCLPTCTSTLPAKWRTSTEIGSG